MISGRPDFADRGMVHLRHLLLLSLAVVMPRLLVISHSIAPARDSLRFIEAAQKLERLDFVDGVKRIESHPGYPLTLSWAHRTYLALGGDSGPRGWIRSGQAWSLGAFVLFLFAAYAAGTQLWNASIAFWGCLAMSLLPRPMSYSVDLLSDNLHAALWMGGCACLLWHWRDPSWWKPIVGGILSGLAYWTRLEGLVLPLAIAGSLSLAQVLPKWRLSWLRFTTTMAGFLIPFAFLAGTYVTIVGGLSVRKVADDVLGADITGTASDLVPANLTDAELTRAANDDSPISAGIASAPVEILAPVSTTTTVLDLDKIDTEIPLERRVLRGYERTSIGGALLNLGKEIGEETRIWTLIFLALSLLLPGVRALRFPQGFVVILAVTGICLLLLITKMRAGYMAGRYALPVLPFLVMGAIQGMQSTVQALTRLPALPWERTWNPSDRNQRRTRMGILLCAVVVLAFCVPRWFRPLHESLYPNMQAALWLQENSAPGDRVYDHAELSAFFAERDTWKPGLAVPSELPIQYAIIDAGQLDRTIEPELTVVARVHEQGKLVGSFPRRPGSNRPGIYLFEMPRRQADRAPVARPHQ